MSTKKPSLQAQIKTARQEAGEHAAHAARLTKELEHSKTHNGWATKRAEAAEAQLKDIHAFLDNVPNPPPAKSNGDYPAEISAMTRLSVFLATRA